MKLSDLFRDWELIRQEMVNAIRPLTEAQLDWVPERGTNSIGGLLRHISETEVWWFGDVVLGEQSYTEITRDDAPNSGDIIDLLDKSRKEYTLQVLESHTIADFDKKYEIPERGKKVSLFWVCWHVFEHECRHRGQILMMMRLQGITPPDV